MMRAYLRDASLESSSDLAPVTTILPDANMSAVVFGSRMRMITAAKRFGLYSALRACSAMVLRSSCAADQYSSVQKEDDRGKPTLQSRLTVATKFCKVGMIPDTPCPAPGVAAGVAGAAVGPGAEPLTAGW